jgi:hypothetical protein
MRPGNDGWRYIYSCVKATAGIVFRTHTNSRAGTRCARANLWVGHDGGADPSWVSHRTGNSLPAPAWPGTRRPFEVCPEERRRAEAKGLQDHGRRQESFRQIQSKSGRTVRRTSRGTSAKAAIIRGGLHFEMSRSETTGRRRRLLDQDRLPLQPHTKLLFDPSANSLTQCQYIRSRSPTPIHQRQSMPG